ncbi:translation initiation factor IF-2-like [Meles meles]|uniref:translation initiation factor IF-2-like n=1 Tax=Meles meles TaxID=9662 RepID=UPI001E69DFEF|nr:translation initiation factor IF-2-like [Meles meles]
MGVFTRPLGRRDPTGRRPAKSRPARRPAAPLSLSAARPAPGARATWRPRRPLCGPLRPRQRAAARRDCCGPRRGWRGGEAGRQPVPAGGEGSAGRTGEGARRAGGRAAEPRSGPPRAGTQGHGRCPPARQEERGSLRGPRPRAQSCPHTGFRQLAAIATRPQKVSRRPERLERKFSLAPSLPLPRPGFTESGGQSPRRADSRVHLLHPWPRLRAQASLLRETVVANKLGAAGVSKDLWIL